jgi:hypothetical protein
MAGEDARDIEVDLSPPPPTPGPVRFRFSCNPTAFSYRQKVIRFLREIVI